MDIVTVPLSVEKPREEFGVIRTETVETAKKHFNSVYPNCLMCDNIACIQME